MRVSKMNGNTKEEGGQDLLRANSRDKLEKN